MSKSKGNVMAPQQVSGTLGAEILRLWVASTDYSGELSISNEILKRVVESYRRMRNTLRFLLANTSDFDPAEARASPVARDGRDRPLCAGDDGADAGAGDARTMRATSSTWWRRSCRRSARRTWARSTSTSSRTACTPAAPIRAARRSAQTALWHITQQPGAADGADPVLHRGRAVAGVRAQRRRQRVLPDLARAAGAAEWRRSCWPSGRGCASCATPVRKEIEALRADGKVGSSLQAEVEITRARGGLRAARQPGRRAEVPDDHLGRARGARRRAGGEGRGRARIRSASAAGTTAPTSTAKACAAAARATCAAPGETRKHV